MGFVVYSHSAAGTYSPWWHQGNPGNLSPWRQCRGWWWGWRQRATGRRATVWQSCPETPTATRQHPAIHTHPAGTHTGNSDTSCWFHDNTSINSLILLQINEKHCVCRVTYPEEQVEEEEHVFHTADATTSHDWIKKALQDFFFTNKQYWGLIKGITWWWSLSTCKAEVIIQISFVWSQQWIKSKPLKGYVNFFFSFCYLPPWEVGGK